jgi:hypothetical protein
MQKRSVLNSPRLEELKRKKRKTFRKKVLLFFILFLVFFVGTSFLTRINRFRIKEIKISGNRIIENKDIEKIVQKNIEKRYLWLFFKDNFLIYPKRSIKEDLYSSLKRIKNLSLKTSNFQILEIAVEEYGGKYLWCGQVIPILNANLDQKCFFLDDTGYLFDEAPYFSGSVYFKFYGGIDSSSDLVVGSSFSPNYFKKIILFKESLASMNLKPASFWFESQDEVNISLDSEPSMGPSIIFNLDSDYQKITENLQTAITTEPLQTKLKENFYSLEYIDLRFGNKVFYKFK